MIVFIPSFRLLVPSLSHLSSSFFPNLPFGLFLFFYFVFVFRFYSLFPLFGVFRLIPSITTMVLLLVLYCSCLSGIDVACNHGIYISLVGRKISVRNFDVLNGYQSGNSCFLLQWRNIQTRTLSHRDYRRIRDGIFFWRDSSTR